MKTDRASIPLCARSGKCQRVLIFNFFGGILSRGIPSYVDNLCLALEGCGIGAKQFRCPAIFRGLPTSLLNVLFVLTEQLVMPVLGIGFDRVIHASNSASIIGCLTSRTAIVVHDFIPINHRNRALPARYIRATQRVHSALGRDVIYISRATERIGKKSRMFPKSRTFYFPNAFYRFLEKRTELSLERQQYVLLCSGWGKNKDLEGALDLYFRSELYKVRELQILGLAGRNAIVENFRKRSLISPERITVHPELSDEDVIKAYQRAAWIWVHSKKEGYGRSIAEARFCGGSVVATSIAPFREQRDDFTFLYSDLEGFKEAVRDCEDSKAHASYRKPFEHDLLEAEIRRFVETERAKAYQDR